MHKIEVTILKDKNGISVFNDADGTMELFEHSDNDRQAFVEFIIEFMNHELDGDE